MCVDRGREGRMKHKKAESGGRRAEGEGQRTGKFSLKGLFEKRELYVVEGLENVCG